MDSATTSGVRRTLWLMLAVVTLAALLVALPAHPALAAPPTFSKAFSPATIGPGSVSTLTFTISNPEPVAATDLAFTDTLPAALSIAAPANATTTCGGTLSAPDGGSTVSLSSGVLRALGSCTVSVDVTSATPGTHTNTTGDLTSSQGNSGPATADLTVATDRPGFSKAFSPSTVDLGERSTLTFTIDNSANSSGVASVAFTDAFPVGLAIADPANASTDCASSLISPILTAVVGTGLVSLFADGAVGAPAVAAGATCTVAVDVVARGGGVLGNSTSALTEFPNDTSPISGKANATLTVTVAGLHVQKEFIDDPIAPGGTGTLRFTITNYDRSDDATNIGFTDDLNAAIAGLVAVTPLPTDPCGTGSTLTGTGTLTLSGGTLPAGGSCSFDVTIAVPAGTSPGAYTNTTGAVTGTVGATPVTGNAASDDLFVSAAPLLTKEFTNDPVGAGNTVTLEFTITDQSTGGSTDIEFFDDLGRILPVFGNPSPVTLPADGFCGPGSSLDARDFGVPEGLLMTGGTLAAGASCTFSATIDIPDGMGAGTYTNTTEPITATVGGQTVTGNRATDDLVVVGAPKLSKEFTDDPIVPGGTVTLQFTLSNGDASGAGDSDKAFPITNIGFTDDLSFVDGLTATGLPLNDICGDNSSLTIAGNDLVFAGGSLDAFTSCTFSVTLQSATTTPQGLHTNTTSDVGADSLGVAVTGPNASAELIVAGLRLSKEFTDDPVLPGGTVNLEFTLDNTDGTTEATGVLFEDDLDDALAGLAAAAGELPLDGCGGTLSGSAGDTRLTFTGGSVPAGTLCSFSVTLDVPVGAAADVYGNITTALSATIDGASAVLPAATDNLIVVDPPEIGLAKEFTDDPAIPGGTVTLEFELSNPSSTTGITSIGFTDDLALTLSGLAATGLPLSDPCGTGSSLTGSAGNTLLTFAGGSLAPGAVCTFSVILQVPTGAAVGSYPNTTSTVTGDAGGPVTGPAAGDDLLIVGAPAEERADLSVTKSDDHDPASAGDLLVYTVSVSNAGPDTSAPVVVTDTLPAGVTFVGTAGCAESPAGGVPHCTLGSIPAGSSASYTIHVMIDAGAKGNLVNIASVASRTTDPNPVNNTAKEATTVNSPPTADAGGPYPTVPEGTTLTLDGSGSSDPDQATPTLTFEWDFDGDNDYDDATGPSPSFTAADGPATVTVALRVTDDTGLSDTASATITVDNVAPTLGLSTLARAVEGTPHTVNIFSVNDPGDDTIQEYTVDWGDGTTTTHPGTATSFTHTYADDTGFGSNEPFIKVGATDEDGTYPIAGAIFLFGVDNVAPTIDTIIRSPWTIDEGESVTVSGTFSDPALGVASETFEGTATWSDGVTTPLTVDGTLGTFETSRAFPDDHPATGTPSDEFTVEITIEDDDGGSDTDTSPIVTVRNVAPVIESIVASPARFDEGQTVTVSGTFRDPALGVATETFTGTATWDDGVTTPLTIDIPAGTFETSRAFPDDHPDTGTPSDDFIVEITIEDDDGGSATSNSAIVFESAGMGPTGNLGGSSVGRNQFLGTRFQVDATTTIDRIGGHFQFGGDIFGAIVALTGPTDFPDSADLSTPDVVATAVISVSRGDSNEASAPIDATLTPGWYAIVVGSGLFGAFGSVAAPGNNPIVGSPTRFFRDQTGTYIEVDGVGEFGTRLFVGGRKVTVDNVAPTIDTISLSSSSIVEGQSVTVSGSFTDPALGVPTETFTGTAAWSDGVSTPVTVDGASGTFETERTFDDDHPLTGTASDTFTVDITITDDDLGSDTATSPPLTVFNVAPAVISIAVSPVSVIEGVTGTVDVFGFFDDVALGAATETFTGTAVWSDGVSTTLTIDGSSGTFETQRTFDDDHPLTGTASDDFTVTITITDDDLGSDTGTSDPVTVNNDPPTITEIAVRPLSVVEGAGGSVDVIGTFVDEALGVPTEMFTGTATWSDGVSTPLTLDGTAGTFSTSRTFLDDHPDTGTPSDEFTVEITIEDDDLGSDTGTSDPVTVINAPPVLTSIASSASCTSDTGEGDIVTVSGSFTDPALGAPTEGFTAAVDWGDGTSSTGTTVISSAGAGRFTADHTYATGGIYTITVTIIDDDTGAASATTTAVVSGVGMVGSSLHVVGTSGDDQTEIKYKGGDDLIEVKADFISPDRRTFPALEVTDIRVVLCGGDDEARIRNGVAVPAMLEGGDGRDELIGGDSPTVMLGGRAKDKLIGSKDRDVIIGGLGKDDINGKDGDDILIGGTTTSDSSVAALQAILAEWTSSAGFDARVANLATPLAPDTAVMDDGFKDKLKGDRDRDWFFADLNGLGNDDDQVKDLKDEDLLTLLETSGTLSFLCRAKWCRGLGPSLPPIGVGLPPQLII